MEDQDVFADMLNEIAPDVSLVTVNDGEETFDFLENLHPGSSFPCLILLDVNMPKLNGIETLEKIKKISRYRSVPVILFSTAINNNEIKNIFSLGAIDYVKKPTKYSEFESIVLRFVNHCEVVPPKAQD
ncbi:MAG: response regulator [Chitinophagaceae bacterium]|nr:response regulator [Chitinophagaceae bacterium]